jgi:predicted AlkP superfamily pyrophosphatase or phosphodiesterase
MFRKCSRGGRSCDERGDNGGVAAGCDNRLPPAAVARMRFRMLNLVAFLRRCFAVGMLLSFGAAAVEQDDTRDGRIVILVALDGFRWDYLERWKPPTLLRLAQEGVRAERMVPSFPTLTFPNLYTLVTGQRPHRHGIVANHMFDPEWNANFALGSASVQEGRWWGGEPLWVTAQKQGIRSACMFWPGSEAEIGGVRPWDWHIYDGRMTAATRVQTVLDWVALPASQRPRMITLYFHEADSAGHRFGTQSQELQAAVHEVDAAVAQLVAGLKQRGLIDVANLVFVSDHGMTDLSPDRTIALSELVPSPAVQVEFAGAVAGLRPPPEAVDEIYARLSARQEYFRVYRREEVPERLHFRDHRRIPPLVLIADEGWTLLKRPLLDDEARANFQRSTHGFDPDLPSMGATFFAWGSAFQRGVRLPPFENVHVYPLVCALLGLTPAENDGDDRLVSQTLIDAAQPAATR